MDCTHTKKQFFHFETCIQHLKKIILRKMYGNYNIHLFRLYMITIIKGIGKSKNDREEYCSVFGPVVGLLR